MATSEEKQELVETIKGPRYYRFQITGYGGEAAYMSISKEAHDFWAPICEEEGDTHLVDYMLAAEDGTLDEMEIDVPEEAQFLLDEDGDPRPWYEGPNEYEHSYGATYGSSYITVDEVDSGDYTSKVINEIMNYEEVSSLVDRIQEESEYENDGTDFMECYAGKDVEYIAQMYSSEKGCFYDGIIETVGEFDIKKLVFHCGEYDNGEEIITSVEYNGVEIDNQGGDTNGKGYMAAVWKNS